QKRRVADLLANYIPEDEALLLRSGRFACTVCAHRPVFDTLDVLTVHRAGKKHLSSEWWGEGEAPRGDQGDSPPALGSLGQAWATLLDKTFLLSSNLNLPWGSLRPLPLVPWQQSPTPPGSRLLSGSCAEPQAPSASPQQPFPSSPSPVWSLSSGPAPAPPDPSCSEGRLSLPRSVSVPSAGWIQDRSGKWVKDENAEFDSDEDEPPPAP
ncbi:SCNM1 protein, partial [Todus mexicanus]|nr:SCNM1 protein [Todus mexicanus]